MDRSNYRVEDFAPIRAHQSFHLNIHLQTVLREFDRWYGPAQFLSRGQYEADRRNFAQLVARNIAHLYVDDDGYPHTLTTKTHFITAGARSLNIEATSTFENSFLTGGRVHSRLLESSARKVPALSTSAAEIKPPKLALGDQFATSTKPAIPYHWTISFGRRALRQLPKIDGRRPAE